MKSPSKLRCVFCHGWFRPRTPGRTPKYCSCECNAKASRFWMRRRARKVKRDGLIRRAKNWHSRTEFYRVRWQLLAAARAIWGRIRFSAGTIKAYGFRGIVRRGAV